MLQRFAGESLGPDADHAAVRRFENRRSQCLMTAATVTREDLPLHVHGGGRRPADDRFQHGGNLRLPVAISSAMAPWAGAHGNSRIGNTI